MLSSKDIRETGLLELYAIGVLSTYESEQVLSVLKNDPNLRNELSEIENALMQYAQAHRVDADPTTKPLMLAQANYMERISLGEIPTDPPLLTNDSKIIDYSEWLDREDLQKPDEFAGMHGYIIGASEEKTTLIVWLEHGAPDETHTDELESFLIVEGTCNIVVGDTNNSLGPGDVFTIPLHINHRVEVTSSFPCKIILERKAA